MKRRHLTGAALISSLLLAVSFAFPPDAQPDAELVFPGKSAEPLRSFWPLKSAWQWEVRRLPRSATGKVSVSVYARMKRVPAETPLGEIVPLFPQPISAQAADARIHGGMYPGANPEATAFVAFQIIDLRDIGLTVQEDGPRLLLNWGVDGAGGLQATSDERTKVGAARGFQFHPVKSPVWKEGELFLGRYTFNSQDERISFDIVMRAHDTPADGEKGPPVDD